LGSLRAKDASECIARVFGVPWEPQPEAWHALESYYARQNPPGDFNAARQRMATMPRGAILIENSVSIAPGYTIGNVHVMAGVPRIMQSMFEALAPRLQGGPPILSRSVHAHGVVEGAIAEGLSAIQQRYADLDLGSYPYYRQGGGGGVAVVAKGTDLAAIEAAVQEVFALMQQCGGTPAMGEPG
jgi:molybdopterin-biosynthesis enzyme MoeA-like protein